MFKNLHQQVERAKYFDCFREVSNAIIIAVVVSTNREGLKDEKFIVTNISTCVCVCVIAVELERRVTYFGCRTMSVYVFSDESRPGFHTHTGLPALRFRKQSKSRTPSEREKQGGIKRLRTRM